MKNKFKIIPVALTLAALLTTAPAKAQDTTYFNSSVRQTSTVHADDNEVVHKLGLWVRSHIYDNWYADLQVGGNLYGGYDDWRGPFLPHLGYSVEAKIGRWVFPVLGYRFGIGFGNYHGFLRTDVYHTNPGSIASHAGGTLDGGLPGYYQEYNDKFLRQGWSYARVSGEMMIRFITNKKYDREQRWIPYMMLGVNFLNSLTDPNNGKDNDDKTKNRYGASITGGLGMNYRINDHWSLYAEARAAVQSGTFDREFINFVPENGRRELPSLNENYPVYAFIGGEYSFNFRKEAKRSIWEQTDSAQNVRTARTDLAHMFNYDVINIVDTLYTYDTLAENSPEFDSLLYRRARQRVLDQMDSMQRAFDRLGNNASLRDIFSGNMLPYEMVFFKLDKWDILPQEKLKIRKMASVMRTFPDQTFLLIGSADSKTGTVKRNDFLSVNRADVVYNELVYEYGIPAEQLQRVYMGGILDYDPFELNRATVIIMNHPKVMEEFEKLRANRKAGGSSVRID